MIKREENTLWLESQLLFHVVVFEIGFSSSNVFLILFLYRQGRKFLVTIFLEFYYGEFILDINR